MLIAAPIRTSRARIAIGVLLLPTPASALGLMGFELEKAIQARRASECVLLESTHSLALRSRIWLRPQAAPSLCVFWVFSIQLQPARQHSPAA